jgi:hypothetical protein
MRSLVFALVVGAGCAVIGSTGWGGSAVADAAEAESQPASDAFECPDPQQLGAALGLPVGLEDEQPTQCLYLVGDAGFGQIQVAFEEGTTLGEYAQYLTPLRPDCPPFAPGADGTLESFCSPVLSVWMPWPGGILLIVVSPPVSGMVGADDPFYRHAVAATLDALGAAPSATSADVDLSNAEIPALCGFPAGRLVNGELRVEEVPPNSFMGARLASQVDGDVDGDGVPEVAAEFICSGGGDVFWQAVAVFRNDLTPIGALDLEDMAIPGFEWTSAAIESLTWDTGRFRIDAVFSASASDSWSTSAWLSVVDGALQVATN